MPGDDPLFMHELPDDGSRRARAFGFVRTVLFAAPFLLVAVLVAAKLINRGAYWWIAGVEDGPIEWLTALFYLVGALVTLRLTVRFHATGLRPHAGLSGILAAGLFFIGMEELSWGQRIFDIPSPQLMVGINRQHEINLHNIGDNKMWLDLAYITVTAYALTARFWVPVLLQKVFSRRLASLSPLLCPPGFLASYYLIPFLLYLYYAANPLLVDVFGPAAAYEIGTGRHHFMIARDQEPSECILAIGFLLFTIWLSLLEAIGAWMHLETAPARDARGVQSTA